MTGAGEIRRIAIAGFCAVFFLAQLVSIAVSHARGDRRFSYQMFAENSYFEATLWRELADGTRVRTRGGSWSVQAADGRAVAYRWPHFVRDFNLGDLDRRTRARTGIGVTLAYFDHALDYVARRIPEDRETVRLVLTVEYVKAGGERNAVELTSERRSLASGPGVPAR